MPETVLIVEDEEAVRDLLATWLEEAGFNTVRAANGMEGVRRLYENKPDLVILDIMMPLMDGFEFCKRLREVSEAPLIILSALGQELDKVKGLDLGADEYVVKPIGMNEFLARVNALLRRAHLGPPEKPENVFDDGYLRLDTERHEVALDGQKVELTPTEFRLLAFLVDRAGKVVPVRELLQGVWGSSYYANEVVKWHVASLRNKIEKDPKNPQRVVTVWGVGYRYDLNKSKAT